MLPFAGKTIIERQIGMYRKHGFTKIIDIKETLKEKYGKNYVDLLIYYLENFQDIINNKKGRKTKKKDGRNAQKEYKV